MYLLLYQFYIYIERERDHLYKCMYVIYRLKNSDTIYTSDIYIYIYYTTKKVIQNNKQTK